MICRCGRLAAFCSVLLGALSARAAEPTVAELGKTAASGSVEQKLEAIDQLTSLGPDAAPAVPQLLRALAADNQVVRWHAARALVSIAGQRADAVPKLTAALEDEDFHVRSHAAHALGEIGVSNNKITAALGSQRCAHHGRRSTPTSGGKSSKHSASSTCKDEQVAKKIAEALSAAEPPVALAAVKSLALHGEKTLPTGH